MEKIKKIFLILIALIFTLFITFLSYYNRLSSDDFVLSVNAFELDPLKTAIHQYLHWQGTFFITLFEHTIFLFLKYFQSMFIFTFTSFILLVFSFYILIKQIPLNLNYSEKLLFATIITNLFFFMSYDY